MASSPSSLPAPPQSGARPRRLSAIGGRIRVLGIDGGGSKTLAVLADESGKVLARGEAGSSNHNVVGWDRAQAALGQAIATALADEPATAGQPRVASVCIGSAGYGSPADVHRLMAWFKKNGVARRLLTVTDAEILLAAGAPDRVGIALVSGTGSICFGRNGTGRAVRAGGWGYFISDEGSGYEIGMGALRLALQTYDGRASAHALSRAIMRHLRVSTPRDLVQRAHEAGRNTAEVAALAPVVCRLAARGDRAAGRLLETAADDLAHMVKTVAAQLKLRRPRLVLGGGLMVHAAALRNELLRRVKARVSGVELVREPALGAVRMALDPLHGAGG